MIRILSRTRVVLGLLLGLTTAAMAADNEARVVYHLDDSSRAIGAVRNITNHLRAAPDTRIVVVALGHGIDFMLDGAKDDRGNPYEPMIDDLSFAGVEFRICSNTLDSRQIDAATVHPEVRPVESGVAEIARLQLAEGFAYIKP